MEHWLKMSASALGRGIAAGEIDPVALTDTYLAAMDAHPLTPRIYARATPDRARQEARASAARAKRGQRKSALDGVPISWKDLFDTAGVATEAGSALLKDRVPQTDAAALHTATALGTVCLGKTHMSELAFSGLGYNPVTQTPPCVNDPDAVAGGSSSGAAASVAFGLAAIGIGSDTGGSVRIPSAWNDLVGLKTTAGRLPLTGVVPLAARFDTVGPLCRSVEDAALMLGVLGGTPPVSLTGATLEGARLLICTTAAFDDIRDAPLEGFDRAVQHLKAHGAHVDRMDLPMVQDALDLSGILFAAEAYGTWKHVIEAAPDKMYSEILQRFRGGADVLAADYVKAWQDLDHLRTAFFAAIAGYDAVILPTSPILPPDMQRLVGDTDYYTRENLLALRNTRIGNLMGGCALTLPTGVPSTGLMLLAPPGGEERLLRLGHAAEAAL